MGLGRGTGLNEGWIDFGLKGAGSDTSGRATCDEAQECLLDQVIGEELLRGVRLEKVLTARARVLREINGTGLPRDELRSETACWNDGSLRGLYSA